MLVPMLKNSMKLTKAATVARTAAASGETPIYVEASTKGPIVESCLFHVLNSFCNPAICAQVPSSL